MFKKLSGILSGDSNEKELKRIQPLVNKINALEADVQKLSEADLRAKTAEFRERVNAGETLDDILPEAFAAVREAARRTLGQRHFDVQLLGGMVLHQGKIAEMKTGEGKTLVATLPAYLNALAGRGVHVVTVNDYLSKRDPHWMGPIYHALGMKVASIQHEAAFLFDPEYNSSDPAWLHLRPITRPQAYAADITYGTNNEFGFDYLRDNLVNDLSERVQRGDFCYAIVDEVDNILIDESRTPLIISGQAEEAASAYQRAARAVRSLTGVSDAEVKDWEKKLHLGKDEASAKAEEEYDYIFDEKTRVLYPTSRGQRRISAEFGDPDMYGGEGHQKEDLTQINERLRNIHHVEAALKAKQFYLRDREYVIKDGEVIIVDEFTGRMMIGRRYSEGLHQAIEAKEGVKIQRESVTLATVTFQNYFRMYEKLAGMTGTAVTEAEEFHKIYKLEVVSIPTNKPQMRTDYNDQVYRNPEGKFRAVVREIEEYHQLGRPILVGTVAVETSELLAGMLAKKGVPHQVLNAKNHEKEARIVAEAGRLGAVTIATNMAGRGVDILLGGNPEGLAQDQLRKEEVDLTQIPIAAWNEVLAMLRAGKDPLAKYPSRWAEVMAEKFGVCERDKAKVIELGGLHIIGTERHESRRIDNQLRGRAGRQGDPGSSRFFVSLQDDIMRRFGGDRVGGLMDRLGFDEDTPIEHGLISKAIESTQVRVEGYHFDVRKDLMEYDDVLNKHRESIYGERVKLLSGADLKANIRDMIDAEISTAVQSHLADEHGGDWNLDAMIAAVNAMFPLPPELSKENLVTMSRGEIEEELLHQADALYEQKEQELETANMRTVERLVMLRAIDSHWREHLTSLENLRQEIGLQAYAQKDIKVAYKKEASLTFQQMQDNIRREIVQTIYRVGIVRQGPPAEQKKKEPLPAYKKAGRNDPCPCGSGKKYKKCCGGGAS